MAPDVSVVPRLDVNSASIEQLERDLKLTAPQAGAIVGFRHSHGPFANVEALGHVPGLDHETFERIKDMVQVVAPTGSAGDARVDVNHVPREQLAHVPGMGYRTADAIVKLRQAHPLRNLEELKRIPGMNNATLDKLRPHLRV